MNEIGCHRAAWIRGVFFVSLLVLSACSDKDEQTSIVAVEQPTIEAIPPQKHQPQVERPPFSQLIIDKLAIDYPYTPTKEFTAFIKKLSARIDNQNIRALKSDLAPVFSCQGASCEAGLPISEQFHSVVASLGSKPWEQLKEIVDTKYYQQIDGQICGPARATLISGAENMSQANWGYITGKKVRLRKQPSTKASIIGHLTHEAVKQTTARTITKNGIHWLEVETALGKKGFVSSKYFHQLKSKQMCYQELAGEWKISGFRDQ